MTTIFAATRLGHVARVRGGDSFVDRSEEGEVPVYGAGGQLGFTTRANAARGEIVVGRVGSVGSLRLLSSEAWATDNTLVISLDLGRAEPRFIIYSLREIPVTQITSGTAMPLVTGSKLLRQSIPLPPLIEQRAIANYLDRETARLDTLIEEQERLIELLGERRKGLIAHALVRGLDASAKVVRTQIPWLAGAEVPAHWRTTRVKYVTAEMRAGERITAMDIEDVGQFKVFGGNGFRGYAESYTHSGTFILIGRQGALCGNVHLVEGDFWASEHAIVVTPGAGVDPTWFAHLLRFMNLGQYSMTAAQPGIGVGQIEPLALPLPNLGEQRSLGSHIEVETGKIDVLIAETQRFIEMSRERRSALISAAVTGRTDVRAVA